jgi:hypothetical protein
MGGKTGGVDILFFKHQLWARLAVNIGIVLVFVAFYFRFLKRPLSAAAPGDRKNFVLDLRQPLTQR